MGLAGDQENKEICIEGGTFIKNVVNKLREPREAHVSPSKTGL